MSDDDRRFDFPGSGLPLWLYGAITAASIVVFLAWGDWLWRAPREASHVMRFVVSYLMVIPLGVLALLAVRRWSWSHLLVTVGSVWCIKMLVTATLYQAFARGTSVDLQPVRNAPRDTTVVDLSYQPARARFAMGRVTGGVTSAGGPVPSGLAYVVRPAPGEAPQALPHVALAIADARYDAPLSLARLGDPVAVSNRDARLHTLHLRRGDHSIGNQPLPPGARAELRPPVAGVYQLRCDTHPGEVTWILVVDHPYVARVDGGAFTLERVPAGRVDLEVLAPIAGGVARTTTSLQLSDGATAHVELDLNPRQHAALARPTEARTTP